MITLEIEKIDDLIETILPERLAQFMLFDGETLNNYEKLVVSEGNPRL